MTTLALTTTTTAQDSTHTTHTPRLVLFYDSDAGQWLNANIDHRAFTHRKHLAALVACDDCGQVSCLGRGELAWREPTAYDLSVIRSASRSS